MVTYGSLGVIAVIDIKGNELEVTTEYNNATLVYNNNYTTYNGQKISVAEALSAAIYDRRNGGTNTLSYVSYQTWPSILKTKDKNNADLYTAIDFNIYKGKTNGILNNSSILARIPEKNSGSPSVTLDFKSNKSEFNKTGNGYEITNVELINSKKFTVKLIFDGTTTIEVQNGSYDSTNHKITFKNDDIPANYTKVDFTVTAEGGNILCSKIILLAGNTYQERIIADAWYENGTASDEGSDINEIAVSIDKYVYAISRDNGQTWYNDPYTLNSNLWQNFDLNEDGLINTKDASLIMRLAGGSYVTTSR